MAAAAGWKPDRGGNVDFVDVDVKIDGDTARAYATAEVSTRDPAHRRADARRARGPVVAGEARRRVGRQRGGADGSREGGGAGTATITPVIIHAAPGRRCIVTKIVFFAVTPSGDSTDALSLTFLVATPPLSSSGADVVDREVADQTLILRGRRRRWTPSGRRSCRGGARPRRTDRRAPVPSDGRTPRRREPGDAADRAGSPSRSFTGAGSLSSSFSTSRATETTPSSASTSISRTPCVARPMARTSLVGMRMIMPCWVMSSSSSPSCTQATPTTCPLRSLVEMLMMPTPPRDCTRYSSISVRLP